LTALNAGCSGGGAIPRRAPPTELMVCTTFGAWALGERIPGTFRDSIMVGRRIEIAICDTVNGDRIAGPRLNRSHSTIS
jgi:hypothetical protein